MGVNDGTYVTLQDVREKMKNIKIGTVTTTNGDGTIVVDPPTAALNDVQVGKEIRACEGKVIGSLSLKYIVPIDPTASPKAWALVWSIILNYVVASLKYTVAQSGLVRMDPEEEKRSWSNYGIAKKDLTDVMNNTIDLVDAVRIEAIEDNVQYSKPADNSYPNRVIEKGVRNY